MIRRVPRKRYGPYTLTLNECENVLTFTQKERQQFESLCFTKLVETTMMETEYQDKIVASGFTTSEGYGQLLLS
jgi:hypothetical protein